ncbi:hypothetical protein B5K08_21575 [Rhizobium leguminosarum bv. trifolii]|uniref:Lytic murein transglycosylase n=1 Tax=Rhizobium leguminosarum bv. trifolii TaxID=386 RepID=A0A3E1B977_RHILT|nr:hypothetical protein B5K08_21575 [Rhizobium leguminosarum bv. trifolii]RFB88251.1 hypothetical protein B5K10_21570 [Rhizobium leguminosarum bv. trifolii]
MCGGAGGTPVCPAGHLPHKGGDRPEAPPCLNQKPQMATAARRSIKISRSRCILPISPLVGEMPGRAEGGSDTANHHPHTP